MHKLCDFLDFYQHKCQKTFTRQDFKPVRENFSFKKCELGFICRGNLTLLPFDAVLNAEFKICLFIIWNTSKIWKTLMFHISNSYLKGHIYCFSPSFFDILASTFDSGTYGPGPYALGPYGLGPIIISQICSRSISGAYSKHAPGAVCISNMVLEHI